MNFITFFESIEQSPFLISISGNRDNLEDTRQRLLEPIKHYSNVEIVAKARQIAGGKFVDGYKRFVANYHNQLNELTAFIDDAGEQEGEKILMFAQEIVLNTPLSKQYI